MPEQDLDCDHALCPVCGEKLYATANPGFMGMLELESVYCKACGYVDSSNES